MAKDSHASSSKKILVSGAISATSFTWRKNSSLRTRQCKTKSKFKRILEQIYNSLRRARSKHLWPHPRISSLPNQQRFRAPCSGRQEDYNFYPNLWWTWAPISSNLLTHKVFLLPWPRQLPQPTPSPKPTSICQTKLRWSIRLRIHSSLVSWKQIPSSMTQPW